jgi:hypothetical protein
LTQRFCSICHKMLPAFLILAGFVLLLLFMGWFGAESRPDFLDPRRKHGPFVSPFRLDE